MFEPFYLCMLHECVLYVSSKGTLANRTPRFLLHVIFRCDVASTIIMSCGRRYAVNICKMRRPILWVRWKTEEYWKGEGEAKGRRPPLTSNHRIQTCISSNTTVRRKRFTNSHRRNCYQLSCSFQSQPHSQRSSRHWCPPPPSLGWGRSSRHRLGFHLQISHLLLSSLLFAVGR